jgi:hypothetical protein
VISIDEPKYMKWDRWGWILDGIEGVVDGSESEG